jgi:membrane protein implicated in regulation of membrane protease activity
MKAFWLLVTAVILAAALMGAIFLLTEDWRAQFIGFSALAAGSGWAGAWRWWQQNKRKRNLRQGLIGRLAEVQRGILQDQRGEVLVDGVLWVAAAPKSRRDLLRGEQVKITGVDGVVLLVEPLAEKNSPALSAGEGDLKRL